MTKEDLAARLNGRQYTREITPNEEADAKRDGLLVILGASDDLVEFHGAWRDEVGTGGVTDILLFRDGVLDGAHSCECSFCGYAEAIKGAAKVTAHFTYLWQFTTELPYARFDIREDEDMFCHGMVIDIRDLPERRA